MSEAVLFVSLGSRRYAAVSYLAHEEFGSRVRTGHRRESVVEVVPNLSRG